MYKNNFSIYFNFIFSTVNILFLKINFKNIKDGLFEIILNIKYKFIIIYYNLSNLFFLIIFYIFLFKR